MSKCPIFEYCRERDVIVIVISNLSAFSFCSQAEYCYIFRKKLNALMGYHDSFDTTDMCLDAPDFFQR